MKLDKWTLNAVLARLDAKRIDDEEWRASYSCGYRGGYGDAYDEIRKMLVGTGSKRKKKARIKGS